ncbi:MAG: hypothetical protein L0I29_10425 [Hyphomicrobiales bacterium]|nr:hypothetical protein [Hyphomicrobiales bacterium]
MTSSSKIRRKPAEPKPAEALIAQYRAIGQASLQAALICTPKKGKKTLEAHRTYTRRAHA